jgi:hypothetical protein
MAIDEEGRNCYQPCRLTRDLAYKVRTHYNINFHDPRDGEDLYRRLREELVPLYYQR